MSFATFQDVQDRFYQDIPPEDQKLVETRLQDAENKIRASLPDLDYQIEENPLLQDTVVRICADAVIRLIRNPEGYIQETDGAYTYMLSQSLADGRLTITSEEWADLGVKKKVRILHAFPQRGGLRSEPA